MANPDLTRKARDTWPIYAHLEQAQVDDETGELVLDSLGKPIWGPIDLSDAQVIHFWMRSDVQAIRTGPVEIIGDPTKGIVMYPPQGPDDTKDPADYRTEWEITRLDGTVETIANDHYGTIRILADLDPEPLP